MNILISNDDGIKSSGIKTLSSVLSNYGKTFIIAPHKDISASSSCLSVHYPVSVKKINNNEYEVKGTPADCVHIGTRGILKKYPDIIFSGINYGSNLGDDVIYSGTVGAAIEGRHARYGSYAISIAASHPNFTSDLEQKCIKVLDYIFTKLIKYQSVFNINIPDLPLDKIKGIKITSLGEREISKRAKKNTLNDTIKYEIGPVGKGKVKRANDFHAINKGYISITPISIDMTNKSLYMKLRGSV